MPKISVIIPVYNTERYLRDCMDSIVNQTLKDIEIICINDGSSDSSLQILKEYEKQDSRIIVIDKENTGAGDSRNKGLEVAINSGGGDYIKFVDSDDYIALNALEILYNKIIQDNSDICICGIKDNNGASTIPKFLGTLNIKENPKYAFSFKPDINTKLYKTSVLKDNHLKFQNLTTCNDLFFSYLAVIFAERISVIDDLLYFYRTENNLTNITSTRGKEAYNICKAMLDVKNELIRINKFIIYKPYFNKCFFGHCKYELNHCTISQKIKFYKQVFLRPWSYTDKLAMIVFLKEIFFLKKCAKFLFSIKNSKDQKYKVITILGLKIKLNKKR